MERTVVARGNDWEGLYINGKLITEGHSIDNIELANLVIIYGLKEKLEAREVNYSWINYIGAFPDSIDEVIWIEQPFEEPPYEDED